MRPRARLLTAVGSERRNSADLGEADRKARQRGRGERFLRTALDDRRPSVAARVGVHPRDALVGVDHPELSDAVACIELRLETLVVGNTRGGNLDNKMAFAGVELSKPRRRCPE